MSKNKNWNYNEISYLKNNWGNKSLKAIARHLGRSITAVQLKSNRIGLKRSTEYGEYITFNQFCLLIQKPSYREYDKKLLKAGYHTPWQKPEIDTVKDSYLKGYKSEIIAEYVNRSALAINGLLERNNYFKTH